MKRFFSLLVLVLMLASLTSGVVAQDASPTAGSLLESLDYPVIEFATDGTMLTGPTELAAGRYLVKLDNTSTSDDFEFSFFSPVEGDTVDDLMADLAAIDPESDEAPEWYYSIGHAGGVSSPATEAIVELTPGEWVATGLFFGEETTTVTQALTVTGELPEYSVADGVVQVGLVDLAIEMPETLDAGPQIWQVTNTGAMVHLVYVMNPGGPITQEEAVNGVKLFFGMPDATPVAEGGYSDPNTWTDVAGSADISSGVTTMFELDLEPGTYIAFCFVEGPGDLGSHALHGMTQVFTVQ